MKAIFYKNWKGQWIKYNGLPTKKNLVLVKQTLAENGMAVIQLI